jgi:hypothetical protein
MTLWFRHHHGHPEAPLVHEVYQIGFGGKSTSFQMNAFGSNLFQIETKNRTFESSFVASSFGMKFAMIPPSFQQGVKLKKTE